MEYIIFVESINMIILILKKFKLHHRIDIMHTIAIELVLIYLKSLPMTTHEGEERQKPTQFSYLKWIFELEMIKTEPWVTFHNGFEHFGYEFLTKVWRGAPSQGSLFLSTIFITSLF
ncbi:hypothetical protein HanIR_Chr03g0130161 [Helianthus annuus]|nr:hypothetical protein HanIR_Chr03g0130161 [Helianthus annuus]